jgi:hypothetical protein
VDLPDEKGGLLKDDKGGVVLSRVRTSVAGDRDAFTLPAVDVGVPPVPPTVQPKGVALPSFITSNDDFFGGKTLEQAPIYSVQGHLIYEFFPAFWAALDATYYAGGRTTIDGEKSQQLENVRMGVTGTLSLSRHHSIKLNGSTGVYHRTDSDFWAVGIAYQFRWGGGL